MRPRSGSQQGPQPSRDRRALELVRVRGAQRDSRDESRGLRRRGRRRGGRGRGGATRPPAPPPPKGFWALLRALFGGGSRAEAPAPRTARTAPTLDQEDRALAEFQKHFGLTFTNPALLKLALTHRSYLSVTGKGPRESNERLEFLGDSVLGLVTSEHLYRKHPSEHEGQLTKTKSLLVSKAILSRRALAMGLGRFVLMSHSEVESGGRQRLSIIADAFESVIGAIYLDQGFEASRAWIERWLLEEAAEIMADKRHVNYKSHLQEYVQSTFRTHPVYRIRAEMGPDHSKHFSVEVMVGRRLLGEGKGRNKKEAEQAAARDALDKVGVRTGSDRPSPARAAEDEARTEALVTGEAFEREPRRRRGRRGERGRGAEPPAARSEPVPGDRPARERAPRPEREAEPRAEREAEPRAARERAPRAARERPRRGDEIRYAVPPTDGRFEKLRAQTEAGEDFEVVEVTPGPGLDEEDFEEVGRPDSPIEDRRVDPYAWEGAPLAEPEAESLVPDRERLSADDVRGGEEDETPYRDAAAEPESATPRRFLERDERDDDPAPAAGDGGAGAREERGSTFGRRRGRRR